MKYNPDDPNMIVTGGWDYRIVIWDIREKMPVKSIYSPYICGDSIDICDDIILTASWT